MARQVLPLTLALALLAVASLAAPALAPSAPSAPPTAAFTANPNPALVNQTVSFDGSGSTGDGGGSTVTDYRWDLDGNGSFEKTTGTIPTVSQAYTNAGPVDVSLQVTDNEGDTDVESARLTVHTPPTASFIFEPSKPAAGEQITLSSTSSDSDGPLASQDWDLDGDGAFDDAAGGLVRTKFRRKGKVDVGLRVTDGSGAGDTETQTIRVRRQPLELMSPFPVVRLSGSIRRSGKTRIDRLSVRGPKGVDVTVRCHGPGCPFDRRRRAVKKRRVGFPGIERVLTPRVVLEILVSDPDAIGKFTKFMLRDGKAPKRIDKCLKRERRKPIPCPR